MTIKEIAQLAGVSSAAVSRYLNGGYVSGEKKDKIRKVIEETGYQPSAQARILRTKRACLVGVVVPKINSESISRITAGIESVLSTRGYQMLLASTDNDPAKELTYLKLFESYPVDGIILIGPSPVPDADAQMRIFNQDGTEGLMCGNGIRCVAKYLYEKETITGEEFMAILNR